MGWRGWIGCPPSDPTVAWPYGGVGVGGVGPLKRVLIWLVVLGIAAAVGFGLGALTYEPPAPEFEIPEAAVPPVVGEATATPGGLEQVESVPDLVGMKRVAASKRLGDLGVLFLIHPVRGRDDDEVVAQEPGAGTLAQASTSVLLRVRCEPRPCPPPPEGKQLYDPCSCAWR